MEFDRSRVYSSVNADELSAGDKVIVADTLEDLKEQVKKGDVYEIEDILAECEKDRFGICGMANYALAYLVERAKNCTNCGEGKWDAEHKKILCDPAHCGNGIVVFKNQEVEVCEYWKPIAKQKAEKHIDYNHCEEARKAYACAMTNACPNKHYRPFKDTDELVKVWMDGGKYDYKEMPLIWVRQKECDKGGLLVTYFGEDEVKTDMGFLTMSKLLSDYTFTDGSPCGVEE